MTNWGQLGISVALIAGFAIAMSEFLRDKAYYDLYRWHIIASLTGLGVALWAWGKFLNIRQKRQAAAAENDPAGSDAITRGFLLSVFSPCFWGPMLNIFAAIAILIPPGAKPPPPSTAPPSVAYDPAVPFPKLKMQGVTNSKEQPSALINGKTLFVGDEIDGAKLTEINYDSAKFDWQGETRVIYLGR